MIQGNRVVNLNRGRKFNQKYCLVLQIYCLVFVIWKRKMLYSKCWYNCEILIGSLMNIINSKVHVKICIKQIKDQFIIDINFVWKLFFSEWNYFFIHSTRLKNKIIATKSVLKLEHCIMMWIFIFCIYKMSSRLLIHVL